jgi:hypothetical protein
MATNTKELKKQLHESIENIDDEELLSLAKSILDRKYSPTEKVTLNTYQEKRINDAKKSIESGRTLTNEKEDRLVTQWLNE